MSLRIDKINEVKNLDLIYIYTTDSIFKDNTNKYIGIKIVYDNKFTMKADYKDPNFRELIKRVIDRYNKEKNSKKIILLGKVTKNFMKDAEKFDFNKVVKENNQLEYFKYDNKLLNRYNNYLLETIKLFANEILKIESFTPFNLIGFNRNYKMEYTVSGIKKECNLLIFIKDDELHFKLGTFEGSNNQLSGVIKEELGTIVIKFKYGEYTGNIVYDALDNSSTKHISYNEDTFYHQDNIDTLLNNDKELITFYQSFIDKNIDYNILKINDKTFILNKIEKSTSDDEILFTNKSILIGLNTEKVVLTEIIKDGFSKYNGEYSAELDKKIKEVILRKMEIDRKKYIVIEINNDNNYSYEIIPLDNDIELDKPFSIKDKKEVELDEVNDIKKYTKRSVE